MRHRAVVLQIGLHRVHLASHVERPNQDGQVESRTLANLIAALLLGHSESHVQKAHLANMHQHVARSIDCSDACMVRVELLQGPIRKGGSNYLA